MPELPEIETIKNQLKEKIVGLTIKNIEIRKPKLFYGNKNLILNKKIVDVRRRAKIVIIDLENDYHLLFHLKMSGQLLFDSPKDKNHIQLPNKFSHIIFDFGDGQYLYFNEMRQFGWARIVNSGELKVESEKLGIEPLSKEFIFDQFKKIILKKPKSKIKPMLMDQSLIAGIGNIYASEICFYAKVLPDRIINALKKKELKDLYNGTIKILKNAIKYQGTSADQYLTITGEPGSFVNHLQVYGQEGQKCPRCSGIIKKIKLAGRGTYFCPICQR